MFFKVFCDGFQQGKVYEDAESALSAYKIFSCEYRKDLTIVDKDDLDSYGKILNLPIKLYKDLTVDDVLKAVSEI